MNSAYDWASSQPVWIQVLIALFLFFVALPALLIVVIQSLRLIAEFGNAISVEIVGLTRFLLGMAVSLVALVGCWYAILMSTWEVAYFLGDRLSLSPKGLSVLHKWLAIGVASIAVVGTPLVIYLCSPKARSTVAKWRSDLGIQESGET